MKLFTSPKFQLVLFYFVLVGFCCAPIWTVEYFINQDGSGHLYSSYIMLELLRGNPNISEVFAFNSFSVPNSSGHWLLALLLTFFSSFTTTKIIVTLTFAGFIASIGWLRWKTYGNEGLKTSLLIGAAIGFNWLWFLGFYNFIIGVICFVFTIGLFYGWREKLNFGRTFTLSLLLLLTYLSHIVSFGILAGSLFLLAFSISYPNIKKTLFWLFLAFLPILPLAIIYKTISVSGGGFFPVWRNLENPFSPFSWFSQIRNADPFILISRKSFPFVTTNSPLFAIFTPIVWIFAALISLTFATFSGKDRLKISKTIVIFVILLITSVFTSFFAPDDFGLNNGSILRERVLLCGLVFFIPLFQVRNSPKIKRFAQICLCFVILFQTSAIWDYSLQTNREAKEFIAAKSLILENDSIASVVILKDGLRFHSLPMSQMNNYLGFNESVIVWDNYEAGHYLFPIIAKSANDKSFVLNLTASNVFTLNNSTENFEEKLGKLDSLLSANHGKLKTLLVWGKDARVEKVLFKWFEIEPEFQTENVRIFHHR